MDRPGSTPMASADDIIRLLGLCAHPEGGAFVETYRDQAGTAIYFLLRAGERSHWHRVPSAEIWHFYAGAPLELSVADGDERWAAILGTELATGHRPQLVVPPGAWQSARSLGAWTLVGCTVSPPFEFATFELAPPDWRP